MFHVKLLRQAKYFAIVFYVVVGVNAFVSACFGNEFFVCVSELRHSGTSRVGRVDPDLRATGSDCGSGIFLLRCGISGDLLDVRTAFWVIDNI